MTVQERLTRLRSKLDEMERVCGEALLTIDSLLTSGSLIARREIELELSALERASDRRRGSRWPRESRRRRSSRA